MRLFRQLGTVAAAAAETAESGSSDNLTDRERAARDAVVELMIRRLETAYSDFIQEKQEYEDIPPFFRNHLYAPPNKADRDETLEKLYDKLKSVTGPEMTANIYKLIQLIKVTDALDLATGRALLLGRMKNAATVSVDDLGPEDLLEAAARAGRFEDRRLQIVLIQESLEFFFTLSKMPLIKLVMAPIKVAASLVGAGNLVDTMMAGYNLSRKIKDLGPFLRVFVERETHLIEELQKLQARL